ncbi:hypothetical protein FLJC2902T_08810 [Flavobacterium limnosediminis JC2902]|uniref:DUF1573 domain-containing protein n=1 Tax=Flavobacterium limnosediminis JC2902 TaxID=1341181 RepID=V6SS60_9FLAO|nr:DUF1573 domain-containing protein [Flavobacterium limnosediminis]ESU29476.1 hypothetical protein FLJC2902T_08810 [Flavobacterium limnosediminis JC2902]
MKKILLLGAFFVFGLTAATAQEIAATKKVTTEVKKTKKTKKSKKVTAPEVKGPGMVFENETIDYGTINQNADGQREFVFTNNGDQPLIIKSAQGSCGCTVPEAPKEPIAPGAKGVIKVKYDTNRVGTFQKNVTITSNVSETPKLLTIKGDVKANPVPATPAPAQTPVTPVPAQEVKS